MVHEAELEEVHTLVQTRIRVDRFTGGAMDNYLFSEAPVFGGAGNNVTLRLVLRNPREYEIGLLLLLLKDLWTGDLPVGGESSVGRGRLRGLEATLSHAQNGDAVTWTLSRGKDEAPLRLTSEPEQEHVWQSLERYAALLNGHLRREVDDAQD